MKLNTQAYFGMGCFWGPEFYFSKLKGIVATQVGYAGGRKQNPTYHDLGDHTEVVSLEFDPSILTYANLLEHFFKQHNPTHAQKTQYRSLILFTNSDQQEVALAGLKDESQKWGPGLKTAVEPFTNFYPAEEYHQQYFKRNGYAAVC